MGVSLSVVLSERSRMRERGYSDVSGVLDDAANLSEATHLSSLPSSGHVADSKLK